MKLFNTKKVQQGYAVPLGSPIKKESKVKKFINNAHYKLKYKVLEFSRAYQIPEKLTITGFWVFDVLITGVAIHIVLEYRNIFAYGLASALFLYYLEKVTKIIKTPVEKKDGIKY